MPYEYNAVVTEIVDGDTLIIDIDLGFNVKLTNQTVRLLGIDTPESRTSDKIEKLFGNLSKEYVKTFVDNCKNKEIIIKTFLDTNSHEKFGRILAEVINKDTNIILNEDLIKRNYAVKYSGENKELIKSLHFANRKFLIDNHEVNLTYAQAGLLI